MEAPGDQAPAATSTTDTSMDVDETMSDRYDEGSDINEDKQQDEDVDDDEQSEYSYYDSGDEDGECYHAAPAPAKAAAAAPPVAVATVAAKAKPKGKCCAIRFLKKMCCPCIYLVSHWSILKPSNIPSHRSFISVSYPYSRRVQVLVWTRLPNSTVS